MKLIAQASQVAETETRWTRELGARTGHQIPTSITICLLVLIYGLSLN